MIYLNPTINQESPKQILDDDNFWRWFHREFSAQWWRGQDFSNDMLINNSKHIMADYPRNVLNFHLELVIEVYERFLTDGPGYHRANWKNAVDTVLQTCRDSKVTVVASHLMYEDYKPRCQDLHVLPTGLNTDLFKPLELDKKELRAKYGLPEDATIGFWSGNHGVWRGWSDLNEYAKGKNIFWIVNYYRGPKFPIPPNSKVFHRIPQRQINELYNASDFYLCTSQIKPYCLSDWEAIASGTDIIDTTGLPRELGPEPTRAKLLAANWGRNETKKVWADFLRQEFNVET